MRALKIAAVVSLLTTLVLVVVVSALLAWLVRSEQGSRWLLEQGLVLSPVTIEASGISGTLAEGLDVQSLTIALPTADVRARAIKFSWSPASLLEGIVDINSARIAELSVDVVKSEQPEDPDKDPDQDRLFWLQIPLQIVIESGRLDRLRIEAAEFENLNLVGSIGHGRLDIETLAGRTAGVDLQINGELAGPAPGRLEADASWQIPAENLNGSGSFSGDINELGFTQVANVPETVNFTGTLYDLFESPSLRGVADWPDLRVPVETMLYSKAGRVSVSSDFRSAHLDGNSIIVLEGWPEAPVQLKALVDLQGISIETYSIETLGGQVIGSGQIDYADGLQGQLAIDGTQIDTALLHSDLPGQLGFEASLQIESVDKFSIDVKTANARIADIDLTGQGRVHWHKGTPSAVNARIEAGANSLTADIKLGTELAGTINASAPQLATLFPGLAGSFNASVSLGGSLEKPRGRVTAKAASVSYGSQSLETLTLSAELQADDRLTGELAATRLVYAQQQLGDLDFKSSGTITEHRSDLKLSGGVVAAQLAVTGGWDGTTFMQRFEYGQITPDGFESWQLQQNPELRVSAAGGQVSEHCWKQQQAGICIAASQWAPETLQTAVIIDDFALATLQPLLPEGYSIDGAVNADLKLTRNTAGLQASLQWRQARTLLTYADEIDQFQTVVDAVNIDLQSDQAQTSLTANLGGEQGLNLAATAKVYGPLQDDSPLKAAARGKLPSIELLRPLVHRVVHPGVIQGEFTMDLDVAGTLGDPLFSGGARLANGSLELLDAGITLSDIYIEAQSQGTDRLQVTGELRSGDGSATLVGELRATEDPGLEADVRIQGQNLATLRIPDLSVDTSPDLTLRIGDDLFDISGTLTIPHALAEIRKLPESAVPRSTDVVVHAQDRSVDKPKGTIVTGNVEVVLGDDVRFNGFGLTSRLDGRLTLMQSKGGFLRSGGTVRVRDGFLTGYGRELRVDRGELTFTGPLDDPLINIQVSRESIYQGRQYIIGLRLTGSAQNVRTEPFSRPAMSERDVLSFLLLDRPASSDSDASGAALALGLQQLVPDQSGVLGLDEVSFETNTANEATMVAGKRINDRLFVRYVFGTRGEPGAFRIRYQLGRGFSLEASSGSTQSLDLIYLLER